jgi:hypothetical protein
VKREGEGGQRGRNTFEDNKRRGQGGGGEGGAWGRHQPRPQSIPHLEGGSTDEDLKNKVFAIVVRHVSHEPRAMQAVATIMAFAAGTIKAHRIRRFNRAVANASIKGIPGCSGMDDEQLDGVTRDIMAVLPRETS